MKSQAGGQKATCLLFLMGVKMARRFLKLREKGEMAEECDPSQPACFISEAARVASSIARSDCHSS
jgi:hypothetical protein